MTLFFPIFIAAELVSEWMERSKITENPEEGIEWLRKIG
jgi:hypothetical protein